MASLRGVSRHGYVQGAAHVLCYPYRVPSSAALSTTNGDVLPVAVFYDSKMDTNETNKHKAWFSIPRHGWLMANKIGLVLL